MIFDANKKRLFEQYQLESHFVGEHALSIKASVIKLTKIYITFYILQGLFINLDYFIFSPPRMKLSDLKLSEYSFKYLIFQNDLKRLYYISSTMALITSVSIASLIYSSIKEAYNKFHNAVKNGIIEELGDNYNGSLKYLVLELAENMDIPKEKIRFWKSLSYSNFPSIEQINYGDINIIIPFSYFIFHNQNPNKSRAILAHELGHIIQNDTELFLLGQTFYTTIRLVVIPLLFFNSFIGIITFFTSNYNTVNGTVFFFSLIQTIVPVIFLVFYIKKYIKIKNLRKESEHMADLCACVFSDFRILLSVLKDLKSIKRKSYEIIHPNKLDRAKFIENIEIDNKKNLK